MEALHYADSDGKHADIIIWDGCKDKIEINPDGCIVLHILDGARLYKCGLADLMHALEEAVTCALDHVKSHPNELWDVDRDCGWELE